MLIIPAIDVLDGKVVRLQRGERDKVTVYFDDPVEAARHWKARGARFLHLVNLNGAFGDAVDLSPLCARLASEVGVPVEVGGGIRSAAAAEAYVRAGAARVVLGTSTVRDSGAFLEILDRVGGERVLVSIDVKAGRVATHGWTATVDVTAADLARRLRSLGVGRLMVTDIARDGMMTGPNVELMREVAKAGGLPVIASGGVATLEDLKTLKAHEAEGIEGVIVGKALYEGKVRLEEVCG
jgi:phosphoribosylformimino-5-aminoimidazole carboxamide ribotide isomerase